MIEGYPLVYIIILNWNGWKDTIECLESLKKATYKNFFVVVVDNASKNDSIERILEWAKINAIPVDKYEVIDKNTKPLKIWEEPALDSGLRKLNLLCAKENFGFCGGNNKGMELAINNGADYLLILNNDTICESDFIEPLIEVAESCVDTGLVGGIICYAEYPELVWFGGGRFNIILENSRVGDKQPLTEFVKSHPLAYYETEWISGCMTLIPCKIYEIAGGYNEDFFIWCEEWDLSLRIRNLGYRLYIATGSRIYHKAGMSLGRATPMVHYYANRNRLILKEIYLRGFKRILWYIWYLSTRIIRFSEFAIKGRFDMIAAAIDAIRDFIKGNYGKWSKHRG